MTTRPRPTPRSTIERNAARQARVLAARVAEELRTAREDAGISLTRLAAACGMSKGQLWRIEAGRSQPGWEVLARLCTALGRRPSLTLYPDSDPLIRDHLSAVMIAALLDIRHDRWRPRSEVPVHQPVRGGIDVALDAAAEPLVACEAQSDLRRIEQQVRWFRAKADALRDSEGSARSVNRLLLLRSTRRTRAIAAQHGELLRVAYPARAAEAYAALIGESSWPGDAILWCEVADGQATILDRPPRGIRVGR
jgi:transcriptional regulator with XRE-family HTH domain